MPGRSVGRSIDAVTEKGQFMTKYEFTLVIGEAIELTEEIADELFAAGCDDATPGTCDGVFVIDFCREAETLEEAIQSAIANTRQAGLTAAQIQIEAAAVSQTA